MKRLMLILPLMLICVMEMEGQKVGIGTTTPVALLNLVAAGANPTTPGLMSTGILRIGVGNIEGIDIGKMAESPFSGWLQSGYNGTIQDPLCLQPMGGQVGIGTNNPITKLHIDVGTSYADGFLIQGNNNESGTVPNLLPGSRLMFFPGKSAFRAGYVHSTVWDDENTGHYSVAMGYETKANGEGATALGYSTIASGYYSLAAGVANSATGDYSTAMGLFNHAKSSFSSASGLYNIAKGYSSSVLGMYNDSIVATNQTVVTSTTPLFIIGNGDGTAPGQRKNAMVVRKDGRVGIGTSTPAAALTLIGPAGNPTIPNITSTGIFRIGLNASEAIDMGKMTSGSFAGWIQVGIDGELADPLSLQPVGGKVGIGTTSPASSAVLDVSSTTKGFLPPRMTLANRNSIGTPAEGLMIWCTNCGAYGQLQVYNGTFWSNMAGSPGVGIPVIGQFDGGGIIAYILQSGDPGYVPGEVHGLIVAVNVQSEGVSWGCSGINIPGAAGTALGTGNQNTLDIASGCSTEDIAAKICNNLVSGGYSDWYLPSKDELNKLYLNHASIGGFISGYYWSSSENSSTDAWVQYFIIGGAQSIQSKSSEFNVRAVRSF